MHQDCTLDDSEPPSLEELKTEGLHSFWGMIGQVMKELHMDWDEILYKRSWINIKMMLADAPRLSKRSKKPKSKTDKKIIPIDGADFAKELGL